LRLPDIKSYLAHSLDSSIRVTYHPRAKKVSQFGFYTKSFNQFYSQRITIFNTKSTSIEQLKVIDQVPVSENPSITVTLNGPALNLPAAPVTISKESIKAPPPVTVSEGVVAQWDISADEPNFDMEALGKDGKFNWVCSVPSQGKINHLLQWERLLRIPHNTLWVCRSGPACQYCT
jgi:hypothetical protein